MDKNQNYFCFTYYLQLKLFMYIKCMHLENNLKRIHNHIKILLTP